MTVAHGNPAQDMHELLLRFLGAFSHLQICIDEMVAKAFFSKRMPKAADVVWKRAVSRIRDDERTQLFQAIAEELGTDAELDNFNQVYADVKRLRDKAAHAARVQPAGKDLLTLTASMVGVGPTTDLSITELDRGQLVEAVQGCRWLEAQILYVIYSTELSEALYIGERPIEVVRPTRLPKDWNGVVFQDIADPGRCTI
jgi:hypothetical protein